MMIVLVLLFRWNDDLCSSASGMTRHTLHTAHTTIQASINRNSTMVSTHIRSAEGRKTHTRTHTRTRSQNIGNFVLSVCAHVFWCFTNPHSPKWQNGYRFCCWSHHLRPRTIHLQLLNHDSWKIYEIFPLPSFPTPQIQTKPTPLSMEQTNSIINGAKPKFAKES